MKRWGIIYVGLVLCFSSLAHAAGGAIAGSVKDPSGAPFKGAFVRARNAQTTLTMHVLSDPQGKYRMEGLPFGDYEVSIRAVGYRSEPKSAVKLSSETPVSLDFALQKSIVRWTDLSDYQMRELLPEGKGKEEVVGRCTACHGLQSRMASTRRDEAGWKRSVDFMRNPQTGVGYFLTNFTDEQAANTVAYLTNVFGVDSELPRSPAELPQYEKLRKSFSDQALNIVYVDYELGPSRFAWNAAPDNKGSAWMPYYGNGNRIGKLNLETGKVEEFRTPEPNSAGVHSAMAGPDGTVWFTQQATGKLGKYDPRTGQVTEHRQAQTMGPDGKPRRLSRHTVRVDSKGMVWTTGSPVTRYDPKTDKFTEFWEEAPGAYGIALDKEDNVWLAVRQGKGNITKIDGKTLKVTKWNPPSRPRRIQVDAEGMVWYGGYDHGTIGRFDPKTETFKEYPLPGPSPTAYALALDGQGYIWYSSRDTDILGRLDPKTGEVIEYPFPYAENTSRDYFTDAQGRVWFTSPANSKAGYLYVRSGTPMTVANR
ncbi:MAG: hypothetical protein A3H28_08585 [Acidobacteria bacterium RIFCSPLOWO2_02_FULL_61_28]|nr:MAG: hypothetical protein A3H28_08585 [Acidobacteria bacterium RIFCSPLOWO2_02_FULL_61_28]